ncbi:MAG: DoxX family protein [Pyrinomonadaceae bacterium]
MVKELLFGGESGLSLLANVGLALLRIFTGISLAMAHGIGKLPPSEKFVEGVSNMGLPAPIVFAWAASLSESVGAVFLALGLFTRFSAFFIACVMLGALIGVHAADPYQKQELAFLYLFIAIAFMLKGSGDWSIDSFLRT